MSRRASRGLSCLESAFDPRQRSQSHFRARDALRAAWRQRGRARRSGQRQPAARRDSRNGRQGARLRLGLAEGPADEGRADADDHPGRRSRRFRRRIDAAAIAGAADGRGLRAPAHAGRARAGLAAAVRRVRLQARGRRLARPGASGEEPCRRTARLQAAISRHGLGGGDRPFEPRSPVLAASPRRRGDRHARDRARDQGAGARGARL